MSLTLVPDAIEACAVQHSFPESALFKALAQETYAKTDAPQMQVGALEGAFLRLMIRVTGARRVLEIGTFTGYSTLAMAEALPDDGQITTFDIEPKSVEIAKKYWAQSPHGRKIQSILSPALNGLKEVSTGPVDLVFIDADKETYAQYLDAVYPLLKKGGLVISDNTLWSGRVLNPDPAETSDQAIVAYNEKLKNDPRFETVLLTLRDGVTLSWKK